MAILRRLATIVLAGVLAGHVIAADSAPVQAAEPPAFSGEKRPFVYAAGRPEVPDLAFTGPDGKALKLSDFRGKVVLLNLWATWCPPCVKEMPSLDNLQAELGGEDFEVVALSLDRGGQGQVEPFFMETDLQHLTMYLDPAMTAMKAIKPPGLPVSLLIDAQGREIGRLSGEAIWDGDEAKAFIRHFMQEG
ncbi:TlpA family protein disulfide reductase [Indioceanicola profundi]|uniref:TlpA family protein disulfide reductase n=1 Tax=Indioceanicola profundi TaxID=2220096 RepID=UPI001CED7A85|nr:TlpA disulfide reductase family protein [Indioceanicola profundi]